MSEIDTERLQEALLAYRRNRRTAARARGEDISAMIGRTRLDGPEPECLEGIGATPEELMLFLLWKAGNAQSDNAHLQRAAALGMAVEVSMHEMHSEASAVSYALSWAATNLAEGVSPGRLDKGRQALDRLTSTMTANARLGHRDSSRGVTGKDLAAALTDRYGHHLERSRMTLEFTDAFLASKPGGRENVIVPVYLNLVGNAWLWTDRSDRARTIRLDAYAVDTPAPDPTMDPDDPDDGWMAHGRSDDILVVEDSGPGIAPDKAAEVFRPFKTGRFGGTGVGLYLCRRNLGSIGDTVVLDPAGSTLGGARFLVGPKKLLDPVPPPPLTRIEYLALEAIGIANLHLDGRSSEILRQYADTHAEICTEALRVRFEGPTGPLDLTLLKAADAMSGILDGRLDASALEPFEDPSPFPAPGR